MSGNSSDSESSCGWTIINHEGSDIETLHSETEAASDNTLEHSTTFVENVDSSDGLPDTCRNEDATLNVENIHSTLEHQLLVTEVLPSCDSFTQAESSQTHGECCDEDSVLSNEGHLESVSDDSDIATLEPPKVDEIGSLEEEEIQESMTGNTEMNMSFSSSSQYAFSQPGTVFPSEHSADDSSNDEASDYSGPVLRQQRSKRSNMSGSECENRPSDDHPVPPEPRTFLRLGSNLNKCIVLSLLIAISMGFGHFYGTIQILERQKFVETILENELNDMKDDLFQCQKQQESTMEGKSRDVIEHVTEDLEHREDMVLSIESLMDKMNEENQMLKQQHTELKVESDDLTTSLKTTEAQNKNLALENQHLRESLEKEEQALSSLKEELRKLREQIRHLDKKERHDIMLTENQKLKEHLKEERQKVRSFRAQKETLLSEAQLLRNKLDEEQQITDTLRVELEIIHNRRLGSTTNDNNLEIEHLKERLIEFEKKLNFEQQRSDLWERLYIEAKEQNEKSESRTGHIHQDQTSEGNAKGKAKKVKDTFFTSVKDTFDVMKNSTKEFVRHHKEKIKQAKEAVKENLKKFSDSVKTTFRHFKDSTKSMFDKNRYRKPGEKRREETKEAHTVRREYKPDSSKNDPDKATDSQHAGKDGSHENTEEFHHTENWQFDDFKTSNAHPFTHKKGCSGVLDCAHQESLSLFNKVVDPVRLEEFHDLMHIYLQEQVDNFQHWKELEQFINRFFPNGIFIHDQMLFTDFVKDVEDYLEDIKQYQSNTRGVFEDLDDFVYRHFFGTGYSAAYGPRKPENTPPSKDPESNKHRKQEEKHHSRYKRECKWHKNGRANGRQMANFEIELGQLPLDPKY